MLLRINKFIILYLNILKTEKILQFCGKKLSTSFQRKRLTQQRVLVSFLVNFQFFWTSNRKIVDVWKRWTIGSTRLMTSQDDHFSLKQLPRHRGVI